VIIDDQPRIFANKIIAGMSSTRDGNIGFLRGDYDQTLQNRLKFLAKVGIDPYHTTLLRVTYENTEHFSRYHIVEDKDKAIGMFDVSYELVADALVTTQFGHALFLPLADCGGAIIYDAKQRILMVSHLGRHSTEEQGALKSVHYLVDTFHSQLDDLLVWLSPAVGKAAYPLKNMEGKSLHEVLLGQFLAANIPKNNIEVCPVDTAIDSNYFSHSQFLKGDSSKDGRFAIIAMMRE
jgi:copper oxidase (laccase) domain-containing protein